MIHVSIYIIGGSNFTQRIPHRAPSSSQESRSCDTVPEEVDQSDAVSHCGVKMAEGMNVPWV